MADKKKEAWLKNLQKIERTVNATAPQKIKKIVGGEDPADAVEDPELAEALRQRRGTNRGRPRKNDLDSKRAEDTLARTTLVLEKETLAKLKAISLQETFMLRETVEQALSAFVHDYEQRHGTVDTATIKRRDPEKRNKTNTRYIKIKNEMKEILGVKMYDTAETAELLGVTKQSVSAYIRSGKLVARTVGGRKLVTEEALKEFLTTGD